MCKGIEATACHWTSGQFPAKVTTTAVLLCTTVISAFALNVILRYGALHRGYVVSASVTTALSFISFIVALVLTVRERKGPIKSIIKSRARQTARVVQIAEPITPPRKNHIEQKGSEFDGYCTPSDGYQTPNDDADDEDEVVETPSTVLPATFSKEDFIEEVVDPRIAEVKAMLVALFNFVDTVDQKTIEEKAISIRQAILDDITPRLEKGEYQSITGFVDAVCASPANAMTTINEANLQELVANIGCWYVPQIAIQTSVSSKIQASITLEFEGGYDENQKANRDPDSRLKDYAHGHAYNALIGCASQLTELFIVYARDHYGEEQSPEWLDIFQSDDAYFKDPDTGDRRKAINFITAKLVAR